MIIQGLDLWYADKHSTGCWLYIKVDKVLATKQSKYQRIDIFDTPEFGRILVTDGLIMSTEKDEFIYHEMLAHVPLMAHPNPRKVLVIGGGDGGTVREVLKHKEIEHVDLVEIDEDVIELTQKYIPSFWGDAVNDPRLHIHIQDGAKFIKTKENEYDVVIVDASDPIDISGVLYTVEFYRDVYRALKEEGIMVSQTESALTDIDITARIFENVKQVFPIVKVYHTTLHSFPPEWTFTIASKKTDPVEVKNPERISNLRLRCYNLEYHKACFVLPNYFKERLKC